MYYSANSSNIKSITQNIIVNACKLASITLPSISSKYYTAGDPQLDITFTQFQQDMTSECWGFTSMSAKYYWSNGTQITSSAFPVSYDSATTVSVYTTNTNYIGMFKVVISGIMEPANTQSEYFYITIANPCYSESVSVSPSSQSITYFLGDTTTVDFSTILTSNYPATCTIAFTGRY